MTAMIDTDDIQRGCTVLMELKDRCLGSYPLLLFDCRILTLMEVCH